MKHCRGFTLIEVIVTIIVMAIAATFFVSFLRSTSFTQSPASAGLVSSQYQLIQQMEIITSKYRTQLPTDGTTLDLCTFKTNYVDGQPFVDAANTSCTYKLKDSTENYTTKNALLVTLTDGQQSIQSLFTN